MNRNFLPFIILALALLLSLLAACATTTTTTLPDGSVVVEVEQADTALIDAIFNRYGPESLALILAFQRAQLELDILRNENAPPENISRQELILSLIRDALIALRDSGMVKNSRNRPALTVSPFSIAATTPRANSRTVRFYAREMVAASHRCGLPS